MSDNTKEFKKGDEVVLCLDYMGNILIKQTKIKNITPKGTITTDSGDTFDRDGNYQSKEKFRTVFGYILSYNNGGKEIISGVKYITNINKWLKSSSVTLNNIYNSIYIKQQCDTEKLANILDKLNEIQKELDDMV